MKAIKFVKPAVGRKVGTIEYQDEELTAKWAEAGYVKEISKAEAKAAGVEDPTDLAGRATQASKGPAEKPKAAEDKNIDKPPKDRSMGGRGGKRSAA